MTQYNTVNVKFSNSQLNKLKSGINAFYHEDNKIPWGNLFIDKKRW